MVKGNEAIAGVSAKRAPTKIETVKKALFQNSEESAVIKKAFKKYKPESIIILGTSDNMVNRIRQNLGLSEIIHTVYITDVATEEEMAEAKRTRMTEGKHVIPVPTFEIKKDFSGYMLDPLQIFKSKGKDARPYIAETSLLRPTFSYLGHYKISDTVFRQIVEHLVRNAEAIHKATRVRIEKSDSGMQIYLDVIICYGFNVINSLAEFKKKVIREIEKLTAMNVEKIEVVAKGLHVPDADRILKS